MAGITETQLIQYNVINMQQIHTTTYGVRVKELHNCILIFLVEHF